MPSQFGRYQVLHKLGQGAMSAVYLARDPVLSRIAAVKVLHPDLLYNPTVLNRFFKEAKAVSKIQSPHVVSVHDFGMEGQVPYIIMEFVDGQTLQRIIKQLAREPMDPTVAACLMVQMAEGLAETSKWGIVHRDLKPDNLLLNRNGVLKISDFGICHLKDHTLTQTGQLLGSPGFMSPEQVNGNKHPTVQSDLFSLGAVFYYLLSGRPPYLAESVTDLYRKIAEEPHIPLSEVRSGLDRNLIRLVDTLLQKDPAKRGQGPSEVCHHLQKYLHKKKVLSPVNRIADYVRKLNAAGVQTTSNLSPEQIRMWMGSLDLEKLPVRFSIRRKMVAATISILVLGLGASIVYRLSQRKMKGVSISLSPVTEPKEIQFPTLPEPAQSVEKAEPQNVIPNRSEIEQVPEIPQPANTFSEIETSKPEIPDSLESTGQALLTIQSVPPFAEVFLDGNLLGRTPMEHKSYPTGKYRLTLKPKLGVGVDTLIQIKPGIQSFKFVLMKNPEPGDSN